MGYSGGINPTAQKVPATYCGFEFFVLPLGQAIRCKGVNRVAVCVNVGNSDKVENGRHLLASYPFVDIGVGLLLILINQLINISI